MCINFRTKRNSLCDEFDHVGDFSQVTELSASLSEERETASHASEMLEGETMERMRLERQMQELQVCNKTFAPK